MEPELLLLLAPEDDELLHAAATTATEAAIATIPTRPNLRFLNTLVIFDIPLC